MSTSARRRRGAVLLLLALAAGGLAASEVSGRVSDVEARVGPLVPVLVARQDVKQGAKLSPEALTTTEVPARYAPADAIASPAEAAGLRTAVAMPAGSYVTAGQLGVGGAGDEDGPSTLARGERALELAVAGGEALAAQTGGPGSRVDVLVTTESDAGAGRTYVALENAELLGMRAGDPSSAGSPSAEGSAAAAGAGGGTIATLRVTLRQAVFLTAAQNFSREIRLLARAPGDRGRAGRATVEEGGL